MRLRHPEPAEGNKAWFSRDAPIVALLPAMSWEKVPEGRMRALSRHSCLDAPFLAISRIACVSKAQNDGLRR
jgi:hypothetical protein